MRDLRVVLPTGAVLIERMSMSVGPGRVVVLLGGSGSGKSTFARVLFEPDALRDEGFEVSAAHLHIDREQLGLVPQRGALFDHLDVRGNLDIAARYGGGGPTDASAWLERVGLDPALAERGADVTQLSGGQAQRVSVARALAGRRRLLFLDEPSVGLDPHRVGMLAELLRREVDELGLAAVVVTHDVAFAAAVADELHLLDPATRELGPLLAEWPGPLLTAAPEVRTEYAALADAEVARRLAAEPSPLKARGRSRFARAAREMARELLGPFAAAGASAIALPRQVVMRTGDAIAIAGRVARQAFARPLLFYGIVSVLIGYTVLYVISKVGGAGVRPDALLRQIGGSYIVALAPPLSALLFVAASGAATNAWLGSLSLTRQVRAMEALGIRAASYLWAPTWFALMVSYWAIALVFAAGMLGGGLLLCYQLDVPGAYDLLSADLVDPRPSRASYLWRSLFLIGVFGAGIASDIVAKGAARKASADAVTRAMTKSVVACTLWIVGWELVTAMVVFGR